MCLSYTYTGYVIEREVFMREIYLAGPEGNAYVLMGYAKSWGRDLGMDRAEINEMIEDMKSGDYEHLLEVFEKNFRYVARLVRPEEEDDGGGY